MAKEAGLNRISLRVPTDLFDRLDEKRFNEKTSFQDVGVGLLKQWLDGEKNPPPDLANDPDVANLLYVKEHGRPEHIEWLRGNLKVFRELSAVRPRPDAPTRSRRKIAG